MDQEHLISEVQKYLRSKQVAKYLKKHKKMPASYMARIQGLERSIESVKYIKTLENSMQCEYVFGPIM